MASSRAGSKNLFRLFYVHFYKLNFLKTIATCVFTATYTLTYDKKECYYRGSFKRWMFLILTSIMLCSIGIATHNALADKVVATIPLGYYPFDNDVNSNTNRLYVTTYNHVTYNTSF